MVAVKRPQIERALAEPPADVRAFLLHGPDESGSRALVAILTKAMGADAERIDFSGQALKGDPAALADAAASISLFGGARFIRVDPAGDEMVPSFEALLESPAAANPVVIVAGTLRKDAKLLKLANGSAQVLAFASYEPEIGDLTRFIANEAATRGLRIGADVGQGLAGYAGGDRLVLLREIEKLACYLDADVDRPVAVSLDTISMLAADADEGSIAALVDAVLLGDAARAGAEFSRLTSTGTDGVPIVRRLIQRLLLLAQLRGDVDAGTAIDRAVEANRAIFWKERHGVARQLGRWDAAMLARCIERALHVERELKSGHGTGPLSLGEELTALARIAARRR